MPDHLTVNATKRVLVAAAAVAAGQFTPGATAGAQWVEPARQGWASVALYRQSTDQIYAADGRRVPFPLEGRTSAISVYTTVAGGLGRGFDAWLQSSFHRLELRDIAAIRKSTGLGDLRVYGRWTPAHAFGWALPVAVRAGIKVPVGDFEGADGLIPLGDGQTDIELVAEVGHSFWPRPAYLMAWLGYRWRRARSDTGFDFGNERFFLVTAGMTGRRLGGRLTAEGWVGAEADNGGLAARAQGRRLLRIAPSITVAAGPGELEFGTRVPLAGRNLASGTELTLGYFVRWQRGGAPAASQAQLR